MRDDDGLGPLTHVSASRGPKCGRDGGPVLKSAGEAGELGSSGARPRPRGEAPGLSPPPGAGWARRGDRASRATPARSRVL